MSLRFLLDTNVFSEPLRPIPNSNVMEMLRQHESEIATATVVYHEILFGSYRLPDSKKRRTIEKYLQEVIQPNIPILPYDNNAAKWHALERARLVAIGKTPSFADGQIAAIAHVNDLILVTNNVSDYADFSQLQIDNWFL
ncbi:type II toxin-antitoxin system VapC family toxin [Nodularia spumigena]|uniref:Type II toxin-antitoxin system VapC family toxin n=1 Tax=Nodularia spumigena UHCC 0060 TaxID=3110300 RepID=A0ABU5UK10_NODSP|nr:type II toxin-antitoxin system VapC family toxin [Nodularia spumigena]MEA5525686.1 type II toxin-antitoxin system VapC family toxin [Nodularia spumigena UHCC 0143]MEA5557302.1 type II toxin-antitoxin system VapC family toxin [Nodularia spumigena CH309]MEA5606553.1 type II toxin-antitoxin system VapC family toxin [Nodularia spumigena UHCC 0060]MEA5611364.1 type II toxin-antitoxin system VapC family toxin [Nodularia spumigena UHCC 0040]